MTRSLSNTNKFLRVVRYALPLLLTVLWLCFIYGNSLKTGAESSSQSGAVHELVNQITQFTGIGISISEHFIRKAAHFTEFAVLGILVCSDLWALGAVSLKRKLYISAPILLSSIPICAIFASADEFLQNFSEGRGPSPKDVLIDTSGAVCAAVLFIIIFMLSKILYTRILQNDSKISVS